MTESDVVIVGAGPAGMTAAAATAEAGLSTLVVDEHPFAGGKLASQLHQVPGHAGEYWRGAAIADRLRREAEAAGAVFHFETAVWSMFPGWDVSVDGPSLTSVRARHVVVAAGAVQAPMAFPGWTLPGVITIGAAQVFVNQHRVTPSRRALVVGVNPLSLLVTQQLLWAGVKVVGIVLPPPGPFGRVLPSAALDELARLAHLAPTASARLGGALLRSGMGRHVAARMFLHRGIRIWGVPLDVRRCCIAAVGEDQVETALLADLDPSGELIPGSEEQVAVDTVCTSGGLSPLVELVAQAGAPLVRAPELGGYVPVHGPDLQTPVDGLWVAGSASGVEGAVVAMAQGRLVGTAVARVCGRLAPDRADQLVADARAGVERARREAHFEFLPGVSAARARLAEAWPG